MSSKFIGLSDIHCHILPGIDDGASDFAETLKMLNIARADGISTCIFTPHFHIGKAVTNVNNILAVYDKVYDYALNHFPQMQLFLGQEIYFYSDAIENLKQGKLLTLAGTNYVLFEYSPTVSYEELRDSVKSAKSAGFDPILAHVERYPVLMKHPEYVQDLIGFGAYIQVNAHTITDGYTKFDKHFAHGLLKDGLVHFVASDAHSSNHRRPELSGCYDLVAKKFGRAYADELFIENVQKLLDNEVI